ncbi:MAG TPA: tetratricopeptide repeat protein [Casimicrobiaceae bacterium]|jgi:Flp pilus assembly protein TadD
MTGARARRAAMAFAVAAAVLAIAPVARGDPSGELSEALAADADAVAAKEAMSRKAWDVAAKHLSQALVRHPDEADLHSDLGFAYRNLRDLDRAFVSYRRALALDPRHRGAHEYIGEAYLMAGDLASAEKHVAALRALCLLPCEELKDLEEAVGKYRVAKGLPPASGPR